MSRVGGARPLRTAPERAFVLNVYDAASSELGADWKRDRALAPAQLDSVDRARREVARQVRTDHRQCPPPF